VQLPDRIPSQASLQRTKFRCNRALGLDLTQTTSPVGDQGGRVRGTKGPWASSGWR